MRVISGTARGRKLKEPAGSEIRPTSDLVKESVFNIIQFDIESRRVLDLFAGTGQLGIEALSRGARSSVFVDSKPEAVKLIWENLKISGFLDSASVYTRDALRYLEGAHRILRDPGGGSGQKGDTGASGTGNPPGKDKFDLIFLDPPYETPLARRALAKIIEFDKVNPNGIIICEMKADSWTPSVEPPYRLQKEYKYGTVKIARYERGI